MSHYVATRSGLSGPEAAALQAAAAMFGPAAAAAAAAAQGATAQQPVRQLPKPTITKRPKPPMAMEAPSLPGEPSSSIHWWLIGGIGGGALLLYLLLRRPRP